MITEIPARAIEDVACSILPWKGAGAGAGPGHCEGAGERPGEGVAAGTALLRPVGLVAPLPYPPGHAHLSCSRQGVSVPTTSGLSAGFTAAFCPHGSMLFNSLLDIPESENFSQYYAIFYFLILVNKFDSFRRANVDLGCRLGPSMKTWASENYPGEVANMVKAIIFGVDYLHMFSHNFDCMIEFGSMYIHGMGKMGGGEQAEQGWAMVR